MDRKTFNIVVGGAVIAVVCYDAGPGRHHEAKLPEQPHTHNDGYDPLNPIGRYASFGEVASTTSMTATSRLYTVDGNYVRQGDVFMFKK